MIATGSGATYLRPMVARPLTRIVTMLALLFASLGMIGGSAAANPAAATTASHHEQAAEAVHCAEMSGGDQGRTDGSSPPGDCLSDCALGCAAIPAPGTRMIEQAIIIAHVQPRALVDPLHGLSPESADPPPRTA